MINSDPKTIIFVRHAEYVDNVSARNTTSKGLTADALSLQIPQTAAFLRRIVESRAPRVAVGLFMSPHDRAVDTAQALELGSARERLVIPGLNKMCLGAFKQFGPKRYGQAYPESEVGRLADQYNWRPEGGESAAELVSGRVGDGITKVIEATEPGGIAVVVAHGSILRLAAICVGSENARSYNESFTEGPPKIGYAQADVYTVGTHAALKAISYIPEQTRALQSQN